MKKVLAVVVAYQNRNLTESTVNHLLQQDIPIDIAVWDNASSDVTPEWLKTQNGIQYYISPENVMWTPALNASINKFWNGQEYLLIMNNDINLPPHGVRMLVEQATKPETGLCAPWGSALGGQQDFAIHFDHNPVSEENIRDRIKNMPPLRTTFLMGACVMMRKSIYDEVGPFDEMMPLGADDHDYAIRVKAKGYHIYVVRNFYAEHFGHATGSFPNWNEHGDRSWAWFNEKWAGYYKTEEEAIKSHWGSEYVSGYDR